MSRFLVLRVVVDGWMCGYQLSEEALLEDVFIGNCESGGIGDIQPAHAFMCCC